MASKSEKQLHFFFLPLISPGHIIPMVDIARSLAKFKVIVTIVTTPLNANRFTSIINRDIQSGLPINLLQLQFPYQQAGFPKGCESVDTLPSFDSIGNFMKAFSLLQQPIEKLLEDLKPFPNCLVTDKHVVWASDIAQKFKLPRILFDGMSCFSLLISHNLHKTHVYESVVESEVPFVVPGLPDKIEFTRAQLTGDFNPGANQSLRAMRQKVKKTEEGAYGLIVNSFEELESQYVKEYKKVSGKKVWCIGPVSLCNNQSLDKAQRGMKESSIDEKECMNWLDLWPSKSVIYVCLGSLNRLIPSQLAELGLGLEGSNRPFIWVIRGGYEKEKMENWLLETKYEERVKGRGLLIKGWAPQVLILSHPSVGGFLTHCGWNSTLEGICAGLPMITWPLFAEQFYNEKFVVEILKIGIRIGVDKVVHIGEEEKYGVLVKREQVKEAVEELMNDGKGGEDRRQKVKELEEMAKKAILDDIGSSHLNILLLISDIQQLAID